MTILEYNSEIENCFNPETGEVDDTMLTALIEAREEKIEQVICFYKNVVAMAKAMKEEEDKLKERRQAEENRAERLKNYITYALQGEKFKTARNAVSYSHSKSTQCSEDFVKWAEEHKRKDLLSYGKPTANKTAIKAALEKGETDIPAQIVENVNTIIK